MVDASFSALSATASGTETSTTTSFGGASTGLISDFVSIEACNRRCVDAGVFGSSLAVPGAVAGTVRQTGSATLQLDASANALTNARQLANRSSGAFAS